MQDRIDSADRASGGRRTVLIAAIGGVATVVAAVISGAFMLMARTDPTSGPPEQGVPVNSTPPSTEISSPIPTSPTARPISIDRIESVALCTDITGTGDVPTGKAIWLVVRSDEPKYYYNVVAADAYSHTWTASDVQFGTPEEREGEAFTIYAAVLDAGLNPDPSGIGLSSPPPPAAIADSFSIKRNKVLNPCN